MSNDIVKFFLGDIVYHRVDEDPGLVTAIVYRGNGPVYGVTWQGRIEQFHSDLELTRERVFIIPGKMDGDKDGAVA